MKARIAVFSSHRHARTYLHAYQYQGTELWEQEVPLLSPVTLKEWRDKKSDGETLADALPSLQIKETTSPRQVAQSIPEPRLILVNSFDPDMGVVLVDDKYFELKDKLNGRCPLCIHTNGFMIVVQTSTFSGGAIKWNNCKRGGKRVRCLCHTLKTETTADIKEFGGR